jgi:pterin-4a-carbinolamine dehydratase
MNTINANDANNTAHTTTPADGTQELKSSWVQEPAAVAGNTAARKRVARPEDQGGRVSLTRAEVEERLKSERVQSRLRRMQGWKKQKGGKEIDRVREFPDALSAAVFLAFSALLARKAGLPLRASLQGDTVVLALSGSAKSGGILTEDVLNLAEQLG